MKHKRRGENEDYNSNKKKKMKRKRRGENEDYNNNKLKEA